MWKVHSVFNVSLSFSVIDLPSLPDQTCTWGIWSLITFHGPYIHSSPILSSLLPRILLVHEPPSYTPSVPGCPSLPEWTCRFIRRQKILRFIAFIISGIVISQSHSTIALWEKQSGVTFSPRLRLRLYNRKHFRVISDKAADPTTGTSYFPGKNRGDALQKMCCDDDNMVLNDYYFPIQWCLHSNPVYMGRKHGVYL